MEVDGISSEISFNTIDDINSSDNNGSSTNSDGPSSVLMHFNESSTSSPMLPRALFRGENKNMEQEQEQPEKDSVREEMGEQQEEEGGKQLQGKKRKCINLNSKKCSTYCNSRWKTCRLNNHQSKDIVTHHLRHHLAQMKKMDRPLTNKDISIWMTAYQTTNDSDYKILEETKLV